MDGSIETGCNIDIQTVPWIAIKFDAPEEVNNVWVYCGAYTKEIETLHAFLSDTTPSNLHSLFSGGTSLGSTQSGWTKKNLGQTEY